MTKKRRHPNPFTEDDTSITRHGLRSEARVAKKMKARQMIGSGAKDGRKSDATLDTSGYQFRIESKATKNASYSLKTEILEKIRKEALDTARIPLMTISFTNELGQVRNNHDYVVMPLSVFNEVFNNDQIS